MTRNPSISVPHDPMTATQKRNPLRRRCHSVELRAAFDPALGHPVSEFADLSHFIAGEELGFEMRAVSF